MKKIKLAQYIYLFFFINSIAAQIVPPNIEFEGLKPNWIFISKDTNFIKSQLDPYSSPYWGRQPQEIVHDKNFIYILEICNSQSPYSGFEGSLLHKLDINEGTKIWTNHNNTYVGNHFREFFMSDCMTLLNDEIEIFGYRDMDSIDFTQPQFSGFLGRPIKRIINKYEGTTESLTCGNDTFKSFLNVVGPGYNKLFRLSIGDIIQISKYPEIKEDTLINLVKFYKIDQNMQIDTNAYYKIEYNTHSKLDVSDELNTQIQKINIDTLAILFGKIDTIGIQTSPSELIIQFYDISTKENIKLINEINAKEVVFYPQNDLNKDIELKVKNENLFLIQKYVESQSQTSYFTWIAWYNKNGELLGKKYKIHDTEVGNIYYTDIIPISVEDNTAFFAARADKYIYHILKMKANSNLMSKVGIIKVANWEDFSDTYIWRGDIMNDNKILLSFHLNKNNENGKRTNFTYYININREDLGIGSNMIIEKFEPISLFISPNPASEYFTFTCHETGTKNVELLDQLGRVVLRQKIEECEDNQVNINAIQSGLYVVRLLTERGEVIGTGKIILVK